MQRVLFVSIETRIDPPGRAGMDEWYRSVGRNLGNLLFTNALWRQVAWTYALASRSDFDPDFANEHFDLVVIAASSWLYSGFEFSSLVNSVERLRIPVVMVGLGVQAQERTGIPRVSESALRLTALVAERSAAVGVRGFFTAEVLDHYGIKKVQVVGCPSLYFHVCGQQPIVKAPAAPKVIVAGTRFYVSRAELSESEQWQRTIYRGALANGWDILLQSERPELDWLLTGADLGLGEDVKAVTADYYGASGPTEIQKFILERGQVYMDVHQWLSSMCTYDLFLGSRIHGAVAALLAGTPALLLEDDARTSELAEFADIPRLRLSDLRDLSPQSIQRIFAECSWEGHMRRMVQGREDYRHFLEANGVAHNFPERSES